MCRSDQGGLNNIVITSSMFYACVIHAQRKDGRHYD